MLHSITASYVVQIGRRPCTLLIFHVQDLRRLSCGALLLLELLLKFGELLQSNLLLLVEYLMHALNFFDLYEFISFSYTVHYSPGQTHVVHQHALNSILQCHRARIASSASTTKLE